MRGTDEASLRELVARLIDSTKAFVQAEVALVRRTFTVWAGAAKAAAILFVIALILVNAAVIVLLAALGMALATWLGTAGGLAVAALIGLAAAGLLGWIGARRIMAMLG